MLAQYPEAGSCGQDLRHINAADSTEGFACGSASDLPAAGAGRSRAAWAARVVLSWSRHLKDLRRDDQYLPLAVTRRGSVWPFSSSTGCPRLRAAAASSGVLSLGASRVAEVIGWRKETGQVSSMPYPARMAVALLFGGASLVDWRREDG